MSNLERDPQESECGGGVGVATSPVRDLIVGHPVALGGPRGLEVTRTLPSRGRRMVGAWCFADQYGPTNAEMRVPPHPHTGLQTVSWLTQGEILHRDSLGTMQTIAPGQLNLMTAGHGISHSEEARAEYPESLAGAQLWVALPSGAVSVAPAFAHHADLPVLRDRGTSTTVIMGALGGEVSPARVYTPIVGAEVALAEPARTVVPLEPDFEHAALCVGGSVEVDGVPLVAGSLVYLGSGRRELPIGSVAPGRVLLIGGTPFEEHIVMWWNFVGRSHEEIAQAREEWESGTRFGSVTGYAGPSLRAPGMPATRLKPRGREG